MYFNIGTYHNHHTTTNRPEVLGTQRGNATQHPSIMDKVPFLLHSNYLVQDFALLAPLYADGPSLLERTFVPANTEVQPQVTKCSIQLAHPLSIF